MSRANRTWHHKLAVICTRIDKAIIWSPLSINHLIARMGQLDIVQYEAVLPKHAAAILVVTAFDPIRATDQLWVELQAARCHAQLIQTLINTVRFERHHTP